MTTITANTKRKSSIHLAIESGVPACGTESRHGFRDANQGNEGAVDCKGCIKVLNEIQAWLEAEWIENHQEHASEAAIEAAIEAGIEAAEVFANETPADERVVVWVTERVRKFLLSTSVLSSLEVAVRTAPVNSRGESKAKLTIQERWALEIALKDMRASAVERRDRGDQTAVRVALAQLSKLPEPVITNLG